MSSEDILAEIFLAEDPRRNFTPSLILPQFLAVLFDGQKNKRTFNFWKRWYPTPLSILASIFTPLSEKKHFLLTPTNFLAGKFELSPLASIAIWTSGKYKFSRRLTSSLVNLNFPRWQNLSQMQYCYWFGNGQILPFHYPKTQITEFAWSTR